LVLPAGFSAQERISPSEAAKHVGKSATVCGKVASTAYAIQVVGRSTFLNLERPYPDQPFTVVIWGSERSRFSPPPEKAYDGKKICVSGIVRVFRDEPPRIVTQLSQIEIQ
jgi:hypothetical protein